MKKTTPAIPRDDFTSILEPVFQTLLMQTKSAFCVVLRDGTICISSHAVHDIFSLSGSSLKGENVVDFFLPPDGKRLLELFANQNRYDNTTNLFITGITRDGRYLNLSVSLSRIQGLENHILIFIEEKIDMSKEQGKIEKLEHQATIGTFTSGVVHEFNNVLAGIRGYAQLAQKDLSEFTLVRKAFNIIEQESVRGSELCKNLSLYTGHKKLSIESIDIHELIQTVLELQSQNFTADNVEIFTEIEAIPPILADRFKLQQVLLNLIINARHAVIPKGKGAITIKAETSEENLIIYVSDNGIGIEPHNMSKIFDPFYTSKNSFWGYSSDPETTSPSIRGTGLGLSVCQAIIKQHDGNIDATSQPGIGSTFVIRIPLRQADVKPRTATEHTLSLSENDHSRVKVLVVDDEMAVREVLFRALLTLNADVVLATNASDCKRLVTENKFDLILLDYILPEMNADRLMPFIKEHNPDAQIVFVSGWDASPLKKGLLEKESDGWIDKPFTLESILDRVRLLQKP